MSFHEILIAVMAAFAVAGAIDRIFGNRWGLGKEFEEGILAMGSLALAMVGIVCLAPVLASLLKPVIVPVFAFLGADPAMFAGTILACDMGGGALAVDRKQFSDLATDAIRNHPNITLETAVVDRIPDTPVVVATGPLTEGALAADIEKRCGTRLSFFDAAAPIVSFESLDKEKVFFAARYGRGDADYINCPMNKEEYENFYEALIAAERAPLHDCDKDAFRVYEGCMPIEVLASRGPDTMRFGPLKPVGLTDPRTGHRPWAVVQLRRENREGTMYNLVGFQTNLKFPEQKRVFSMIPGLEHAEFHRYGVMHRNSFLDSPRLLDADYHFRGQDTLYFAGQMTGVEGYMESAASGILAGKNLARRLQGKAPLILPRETMMGALAAYISSAPTENFQPMGANMGILPDLPERIRGKQEKYQAYADRGMAALEQYLREAEQ